MKRYLIFGTLSFLVLLVALVAASRRLTHMVATPIEQQAREQLASRRRAEAEKADLEALNQMKTEVLGNVSHELKTPLTVVSGYAQLARQSLENVQEAAPAREKMRMVAAEADRLALLVGQVLDVTRIEEGRMGSTPIPCQLDEVIHQTVDTYYPILNKNGNTLRLELAHDLPPVMADAQRVGQVLVNLIANAIRYTHAGEIVVKAGLVNNVAQVQVCDNGEGMDEAQLEKLFERYGTGGQTGTGLGLFVCRHIVQAHGGHIAVNSEKGEGTTVAFTLPLA